MQKKDRLPGAARNFRPPSATSSLPETKRGHQRAGGNRIKTEENLVWTRSSSSAYYGACVEIGMWGEERWIRDSKNKNNGMLSVTKKALNRLFKKIRSGNL